MLADTYYQVAHQVSPQALLWAGGVILLCAVLFLLNQLRQVRSLRQALDTQANRLEEEVHRRRQAEEQLVYQAQLVDKVQDAVIVSDENYIITLWNRAAEQIYGWRAEEAIGQHAVELLRSEFPDTVRREVQQQLREKGEWSGEAIQARRDGTRLYTHASAISLRDGTGRIFGYLSINRDITERKQVEMAMRENTEFIMNLLENSPAAIYITGADNRLRLVNRQWEQAIGIARADVVDQSLDQVFPAELAEKLQSDNQKVIETRASLELEEVIRSRHYLTVKFPLIDPAGQVSSVVGISFDITDRKQAEEALKRVERLLQTVLNNIPLTIFATDRDGVFTISEGKGLERIGLKSGQHVGLSAREMYSQMPITLQGGEKINGEEVIQRALDGETMTAFVTMGGRTYENHVGPLYDADGNLTGIVGVAIDITERRDAENALRKSEELYRKLTENYPNGTVNIYDKNLRMTFVAGREMLEQNVKPEDLIGRTFQELSPAETFEIAEPHLQAAFEGQSGSYQVPYWNGQYYLVNVAPLHEEDGSIEQIMVVTQNMTAQKRVEEDLRFHRDRLGELSRQLASVRENEQRAIGRELHDQIGQMLTAIRITLNTLSQLPPEAAAKRIERLKEITDELLNRVSRLSLNLRPPMLDHQGLLPALLWHIRHYQEQTGLKVLFQHTGLKYNRFDSELETTVYRVIQECLTNIARHAEAKHISIDLTIEDGHIAIQIQDDGQGFDPVSAYKKNRGLSGMRERIYLLNGRLWIESKPGEGTQLSVYLPVKEHVS